MLVMKGWWCGVVRICCCCCCLLRTTGCIFYIISKSCVYVLVCVVE